MKRKHPDWLLGPAVGSHSRFAYNFIATASTSPSGAHRQPWRSVIP